MDLGLKGKVTIVSAASAGIGKAVAVEMAKEGSDVSICARGKEDLEKAAEEVRKHGVRVVAVQADVTKADDVQRVIEETVQAFDRVDVLVNNAGEAWMGHGVDTTDEEWEYSMEVNVYSAVRFTRGVVPYMRKQGGGRIINIASVSGHTMISGLVDYQAGKAAMLAFSKTMSIDLAPDNILVNSVCPALEEVFQNLANQTLVIKRYGTVEEVSALVAFLASERASFITGSAFDVDGGFTKSMF